MVKTEVSGNRLLGIQNIIDKAIGDIEYQEINFAYEEEDGGTLKIKTNTILYFPNKRISSIAQTTDSEAIIKPGMTREEIIMFFPPPKDTDFQHNRFLMSVIYEAARKDKDVLEQGNVRHFWYTHIKHSFINIMGLEVDGNIDTKINDAWHMLARASVVRYEDFDIIGGKETGRMSIIKDSPFNNIFIGVEKIDFFTSFRWLSKLFNCTLISAGGTPSRAVTFKFVYELKELGVDLNQTFYLLTATDFDPMGYNIEDSFRKQFEEALRSYEKTGSAIIHRLFVRREQLTGDIVKNQAIPFGRNVAINYDYIELSKSSKRELIAEGYSNDEASAIKSVGRSFKTNETNWNSFCDRSGGGLYIPTYDAWNGYSETIDGEEKIRAIVEMDVFSTDLMQTTIRDKLIEVIKTNNLDESKIMIPEIMRIFDEQRDDVAKDVYRNWESLIDELKEKFDDAIKEWKEEIDNTWYDNYKDKDQEKREQEPELFNELYMNEDETEWFKDERDARIDNTEETYRRLIEQLRLARDNKIEALKNEYHQIDTLESQHESIGEEIDEKCEDINKEIEQLEEDHTTRINKKDEFEADHELDFNPAEEYLKDLIKEIINPEALPIYFRDVEKDYWTQQELAKLLFNAFQLTKNKISCFEHTIPTFKERGLLIKAAQEKDLNIAKFRKAFSKDFKRYMQRIIKKLVDEEIEKLDDEDKWEIPDDVVDVDAIIDLIDIAKEEVEEDIESKD